MSMVEQTDAIVSLSGTGQPVLLGAGRNPACCTQRTRIYGPDSQSAYDASLWDQDEGQEKWPSIPC